MPSPGMQLGKYTLEKRIGSGGMADVWLAKGPRGLCVLKCPHRHLCDNPEFVKMFLDEASLLAQLHHPNIAEIYDLGQEKGAYYLAMEYVPGYDLMTISLEHERHGELMSVELCARIVADAAGALHYAHEAKDVKGNPLHLIHRDVTPHNILLSRSGMVKLIDFGVAKASSTMHRTQAGFVKGKYPYMSPEQITGQIIDRRVDVYALGLVLYELLTNVRAIPGNNEIEQIDAARAGRIRPIEQLRPNIPVPIKQILGACLHFEVEGRYPTALALKEDLEKFLALERQVVGQEDLLRLFRIVAADQGDTSFSGKPTELEQPISDDRPVVMPDPAAAAAQIDALGYSPTAPSMKVPAVTPLNPASAPPPGGPVVPLENRATGPQPGMTSGPKPERARTSSKNSPPPVSRGPLYALTALSLLVIIGVLAMWQPWKPTAVVEAVDAGIPGKIDSFTFPPPEIDAGQAVAEAPDAGAAVEVDAGAAVVAEVVDAGAPSVGGTAHVTINATVPATVTIDGERVGNTPWEGELPAGPHVVIVKGEGIEKKVTWKLKGGEKKTLSVSPAAANPPPETQKELAHVVVNVYPFATTVTVDGKPLKGSLSLFEGDVEVGPHTITAIATDGSAKVTKQLKVTVKAGAAQTFELAVTP